MKKNPLYTSVYSMLLLWFCAIGIGIAQTPAPDLDSITEDSYRRMLERQTAEREADSLDMMELQLVKSEQNTKEEGALYYLLGTLGILGLGVFYWYYLRKSKTKESLRKRR